jgi:hypothetical protein
MTKSIKGQTLTDLETIAPLSIVTIADTGSRWADMATLLAANGAQRTASVPLSWYQMCQRPPRHWHRRGDLVPR